MTRKEFCECVDAEIFKEWKPSTFVGRLRVKYVQPNTNCTYMCRKMWYLYSKGGVCRLRAKMIYLRILYKYGCCIFPSAKVDRGFWIEHPVGIVIGNCTIGKEFTIHQNTTIGVKHRYDDSKGLIPKNRKQCSSVRKCMYSRKHFYL